uniref:Protein FAM184A/B N-terminal domain-containing protein n=1 Tax=Tetraselmis sp. GSL018 TaxID=582737 RepID=A0A061RSN0_9CHLO
MAGANGNGMLPELQLRMSKKIAQLTKVIYHLNNKNEDHEMDLAEMSDQYESEIETVLRDTADKLNAFQAAFDSRREELRVQEIIKKMSKQNEDAKAAALREFSTFKEKARERELEIARASDAKATKLSAEVDALKSELERLSGSTTEISRAASADGTARRFGTSSPVRGASSRRPSPRATGNTTR